VPITLTCAEFATISDAARLLGVSESRVRQLTDRGLLPVAAVTPHGRLLSRRGVESLAAERAQRRTQKELPAA
jgi:DNA-binding transcriptional MerR regulator